MSSSHQKTKRDDFDCDEKYRSPLKKFLKGPTKKTAAAASAAAASSLSSSPPPPLSMPGKSKIVRSSSPDIFDQDDDNLASALAGKQEKFFFASALALANRNDEYDDFVNESDFEYESEKISKDNDDFNLSQNKFQTISLQQQQFQLIQQQQQQEKPKSSSNLFSNGASVNFGQENQPFPNDNDNEINDGDDEYFYNLAKNDFGNSTKEGQQQDLKLTQTQDRSKTPPMPSLAEHERMMEMQTIENEKTAGLPSIKVINSPPFGFWIADDNRSKCAVLDDETFDRMSQAHSIFAGAKEITGRIFKKPRFVIFRFSPLIERLDLSADKKFLMAQSLPYVRDFQKREGQEKSQYYFPCRMYLVYLLDDENNFLHEIPIQLTAKGCFSISFHKRFVEFVNLFNELLKIKDPRMNHCLNGWSQTVAEPRVPKAQEPAAWRISQFVFCPIFKAGQSADRTKQSVFCECSGFQSLDQNNISDYFLEHCKSNNKKLFNSVEKYLFPQFWNRNGWWAGKKQPSLQQK